MSSDSDSQRDPTSTRPDRVLELDPEHEADPGRGGWILLVAWLVLMTLTVGSYVLSDSARAPGTSAMPWLLSFAVLKGHLIAGIYMEMRRGPRVWLVLMSSFLIAEAVLIALVLS